MSKDFYIYAETAFMHESDEDYLLRLAYSAKRLFVMVSNFRYF